MKHAGWGYIHANIVPSEELGTKGSGLKDQVFDVESFPCLTLLIHRFT
jgi:hypothetical protein